MKFVDDDHLIAHHHTTCVRVELVHDVTKKCRFSQSESSSILDRLAFTSEIAIGTCCTTPNQSILQSICLGNTQKNINQSFFY